MLERYYRINQAAGVSIHIGNDGGMQIQLCSVSASGSQLDIETKVVDLTALEQIKKHIPEKTPVALNLSGKGILQKQIAKAEVIDQHNFHSVLPNANVADFYIQNFISEESSFISLIRKTEADRWINQLIQLGFRPLMLSLGPFAIENVIGQLNVYDKDFTINGHIIKRNEQSAWTGYSYTESALSPFPLKIANEKIDEQLIIAYAAAFQLVLVNQLAPICADVGSLEEALSKTLSNNKIKVQGVAVLVILFILLLANFVTLTWLNGSNTALLKQVSQSVQTDSDRKAFSEQVRKKEACLRLLGWDGGISKSSLIDQVASLLPPEIELSNIFVNPIDLNESRRQKSLVFSNGKIQITGSSEAIIPVNEWIARIKTRAWVKNVQMESYGFDNELNKGKFLITINY